MISVSINIAVSLDKLLYLKSLNIEQEEPSVSGLDFHPK